jgi:hypothetical protein
MSRPLPRYLEPDDFQHKLARILIETGEQAPPATVVRATLAGDERRLRGIPCIARGVPGASPGTNPGNIRT